MLTNWKCERFDIPSLWKSFREIFLGGAGIVIMYQMTLVGDCFVVFCITKVFFMEWHHGKSLPEEIAAGKFSIGNPICKKTIPYYKQFSGQGIH